jgi:hypothetical protein
MRRVCVAAVQHSHAREHGPLLSLPHVHDEIRRRRNVYDDGSRIRYSFTTSFNGLGSIPGFLRLEVTGSGAHVTRG